MEISKIPSGSNVPFEVNVVIEVPMNSDPVKYEFDEESGAIFVDRFLATPMFYPCNYGFIPNTLADDGDPVDVLVISPYKLVPSCVIPVRPVGVLVMEDEKGMDEKVIAVPRSNVFGGYENIKDITDVPELLLQQIRHFFERYKDLEKGKWVKLKSFENSKIACDIIKKSVK